MNDCSEKKTNGRTVAATREETPARRPRTDVWETEKAIHLLADMPGVDESSVEVLLEDGNITLRGTPVADHAEDLEHDWNEFELGPYERTFRLGRRLAHEGIRASVKAGVLEVVLPKAADEVHRIPISEG